MSANQSVSLRMTVYASLFAALVIVGGYISFPVPLSPVPVVLSDFFVLLAGMFLGSAWGLAGIGLFMFLGVLGFPVFAGGKAGLAVILGPTGGFLIGFLACVFIVGLISGKGKSSVIKDLAALIAGNAILYAFGVIWLKVMLNITWDKALVMGLIPFIPGMVIKIIAALALARVLRPRFKQAMNSHPAGIRE